MLWLGWVAQEGEPMKLDSSRSLELCCPLTKPEAWLSKMLPRSRSRMESLKKAKPEPYQEVEGYSELELHRFIQDQNVKAWCVMLVWLIFNAIFGALYLFGVIGKADLFMLIVFYFLCDYICILFYCPFQHLLMKNMMMIEKYIIEK